MKRTTTWVCACIAVSLVALCTQTVASKSLHKKVNAAPPHSRRTGEVFDALQDNVWYLPVAGGKARLYVTSLGRGSDVVVLHGGPGNDFNYLVDALTGEAARHRFVLYDQRGSLLSPVLESEIKTLTAAAMVKDLDTLRIALGKKKLFLFGHSWGSLLAMLYYQAHPEHVAGMILAGSLPPRTPPGKSFVDLLGPMRSRQRALRERPKVHEVLDAAGLGSKAETGPLSAQQKSWKARIRGLAAVNLYHVERWRKMQGGGVYYNEAVDTAIGDSLPDKWNLQATLKKHPVPITIIQGDHDYVDPSAKSWLPLEASGQVRIDVIPGAGHYSWIDNPEAFARDFRTALSRMGAGATSPRRYGGAIAPKECNGN